MLNFGNEHVLPEVRPVVTDMPEETYQAVTGGSARTRELPLLGGHIYDVRGVPGHTHNASATVSISGDFTSLRDAAVVLSSQWVGADNAASLNLDVDEYQDSDHWVPDADATLRQYERAVEKAIGRVRVVPENCHQEIDEPTRAIAEIRTIVTANAVLKSMTYVEELGTYVDSLTGEDRSSDFVDSVQVHMFGYGGTAENAGAATSSTQIIGGGTTYKVLSRGFLKNGLVWNGSRTYTFDAVTRQYTAPELLAIVSAREHGVNEAVTLRVTFAESSSTVAVDGHCYLHDGAVAGNILVAGGINIDAAEGPSFTVSINAAGDGFRWYGPAPIRIAVGRAVPFYGPRRTEAAAGRYDDADNQMSVACETTFGEPASDTRSYTAATSCNCCRGSSV